MKRRTKLGIILGGYALAFAASVVAVAIYDRRFTPEENQTMGGMIAGGEMIFGAGVFALLSIVPTALALWFVRRHRPSWVVFTTGCLAFAMVGLPAVAAFVLPNGAMSRVPAVELMSLFGLAQMLGSPIWVGGFAAFAWLAPERDLRLRMLVATAIEVVIGVFALTRFLLAFSA